jgi:predicted alpha/beta superfamily hydrolase
MAAGIAGCRALFILASCAGPLILILDGQKHLDHTRATTVFLEQAGEIPEHIIVGLKSTNRLRDFSPTDSPDWEGADGGAPKFLEFLRNEFLVHLHSTYRVSTNRTLMGHSASGLLTAFALAADPMLFESYFVLDGSLDWDGKIVERMLAERFKTPFKQQRFLYLTSSFQLGQDLERNVLRSMEAMLLKVGPPKLRWVYEAAQTETHASIALAGYQRALRSLYDGWWVPEATMAKGLSAVEAQYELRRGFVGAREEIPLEADITTWLMSNSAPGR